MWKRPHNIGLHFLLISGFIALSLKAQDVPIRVDTHLVTIPVAVRDRDGRHLTDLKRGDFLISDNGINQEVAFFESVDAPFTVFLLLDRSNSMTELMTELDNAVNTFVGQLRPDDQVIAASFANDVDVLIQVTKVSNLETIIRVRKHSDDTHTMLYDAVGYSLKKLRKVQGRKAIILFSDGVGSGILASFKENLRDAEESEAAIYTVQFYPFSEGPKFNSKERFFETINTANTYMKALPSVTGGRSFRIEEISDLKSTFSEIAKELGQQYSLGYYPKDPGKKGERRQIKVRVTIAGAAVRARASYIVGSTRGKR
jgi:VWFA-related protein